MNGRNPWIAALLSLFCTGLGHVYGGRVAKGLALFLAALLFAPLVCLLAALPAGWLVLALIILVVLGLPCLYLYAVVDSFLAARRVREFEPTALHRPGIYALFIAVGMLYPLGALAVVRGNVLQAFYLPASSMAPTLEAGDRILVDKLAYRFSREPARGDVVVLRAPGDRTRNYVKRIVGVPGDRVEMRDGRIILNGERLEEAEHDVIPDESSHAETVVPEGFYFVLGDNRPESRDSRTFGLVPRADLLGPVEYVFLPLSRFGALE